MQKRHSGIKIFGLIGLLFFISILTGCTSKPVSSTDIAIPLPPASNQVGAFNDIELPVEMELKETKMLIRNENFAGGVFTYKGRVDAVSLKDFLIASMKNNKWRFDDEHSSADTTKLAFTKPNKACMMIIEDNFLKTEIELIVTENVSLSKSLDPFGQPIN